MTLTATYDDATGKVSLSASSAPTGAVQAYFQRSTDNGVTWTDVRGGQAVSVVSSAASILDYEYSAGVSNLYRVSWVNTANVSFVAAGAASSGNNATLTPALPAGLQLGDLMLCHASIRNSGTGTPNQPTGWVTLRSNGNEAVFARLWQSGDTAPSVSFTGGAAGADTIAMVAAFRNASGSALTSAALLNTAATNIVTPGFTPPATNSMVVVCGWIQSASTGQTLSGYTAIGATSSSAGSGSSQSWHYQFSSTTAAVPASSITVTGGTSQISRSIAVDLGRAAWIRQDTATVTPNQTGVWLKNPVRPFLNQKVTVTDPGQPSRNARNGMFNVIGRTLPVAVTDLMSGRSESIVIRTTTPAAFTQLDTMLAVGEVLLVQPPLGSATPTMYAVPGSVGAARVAATSKVRLTTIPLIEVAQPDPTVSAVQSTWQTVVNTYATWSALVAAKATWNDVLQIVGTANDVITS
jgi:hypothetical protein